MVSPRASLVTTTGKPLSRPAITSAVPSPSTLGVVAMITSRKPPCRTRSTSRSMVSLSGPFPSSGETLPCKTW